MNRFLVTTASLLTGAALVLGGTVAAEAATPTPSSSPTSSATCSFGEHLVSSWIRIPAAMRSDLRAARADAPGAARRAALKAVRAKALDGGYGADVQARAEFLRAHTGSGIRPLPASLKADLTTLRGEKGRAAKVAEADTIADKALAGDYGSAVEALATAAQASPAWQDCGSGGASS